MHAKAVSGKKLYIKATALQVLYLCVCVCVRVCVCVCVCVVPVTDFLPPTRRSAPSSPTHHPLMASDFALHEVESKFALPHTPPSQFSLPPVLFPPSAIHSSSSLPASPSRPHPGFAVAPFKYFPLGVHSTSVEALAPEVARKRDLAHEDRVPPPPAKRTRSADEEGVGEESRPDPQPALLKPMHPMSLTTIPGASSFSQPPTGVQFFVMNQPAPGVLAQSIPTFLPRGFIGAGGPGVSSQPPGEQNDRNSHEEG